MKLKTLIGSGDKIGLFILPILIVGLALNISFPALFEVGGPSKILMIVSIIALIPGIVIWFWSVILIITKVPKKELITSGPYILVKHPLYTNVALLVLPWFGFLLNTWLGAVIGISVYLGSKLYSRLEEKELADNFGIEWEEYCSKVKLPWL